MRFTYNVLRYVTLVSRAISRRLGFVNVFKKKNCGASLCKSEIKHAKVYKIGKKFLFTRGIFLENLGGGRGRTIGGIYKLNGNNAGLPKNS